MPCCLQRALLLLQADVCLAGCRSQSQLGLDMMGAMAAFQVQRGEVVADADAAVDSRPHLAPRASWGRLAGPLVVAGVQHAYRQHRC